MGILSGPLDSRAFLQVQKHVSILYFQFRLCRDVVPRARLLPLWSNARTPAEAEMSCRCLDVLFCKDIRGLLADLLTGIKAAPKLVRILEGYCCQSGVKAICQVRLRALQLQMEFS